MATHPFEVHFVLAVVVLWPIATTFKDVVQLFAACPSPTQKRDALGARHPSHVPAARKRNDQALIANEVGAPILVLALHPTLDILRVVAGWWSVAYQLVAPRCLGRLIHVLSQLAAAHLERVAAAWVDVWRLGHPVASGPTR